MPGFLHRFWVTVARGTHPFPSRTRKLSPSAPMVLHARVCGSVGSGPVYHMARPKGRAFVFVAGTYADAHTGRNALLLQTPGVWVLNAVNRYEAQG